MDNIDERLNKIEEKITQPDFLKNKGLGNEVGYYIFDYSPKDELGVRNHINCLKNKFNNYSSATQVVEYDLYDLVIEILKQKGYLQKCFDFEEKKGIDYMFDAVTKMLRLTSKDNLLVNHIVKNTPDNSVVFLTGVGKCFPFVRSHNVLNNLHQILDSVPVIMFFPGTWDGQTLNLFGTIKDDNYYRAFPLI